MLDLRPNPTLKDIQNYVKEMETERGFDTDSVIQKCLHLGEETGELFRSLRKNQGTKVDANKESGDPALEMADIIIILCAIANRSNVDLEQAFRDKEEINKQRIWK
jgi:NTP pyrophosphatase (non-canonical NTP hydrolase)